MTPAASSPAQCSTWRTIRDGLPDPARSASTASRSSISTTRRRRRSRRRSSIGSTRYYADENANVHRGVHLLSERATDAYEAGAGRRCSGS